MPRRRIKIKMEQKINITYDNILDRELELYKHLSIYAQRNKYYWNDAVIAFACEILNANETVKYRFILKFAHIDLKNRVCT